MMVLGCQINRIDGGQNAAICTLLTQTRQQLEEQGKGRGGVGRGGAGRFCRQKKAGGPDGTARWARSIAHPRGKTLRTEPIKKLLRPTLADTEKYAVVQKYCLDLDQAIDRKFPAIAFWRN